MPTALHAAAPARWLTRFVEDVRVLAPAAGRAFPIASLPDGRTKVVFRVFDGDRRGDLSVVGPRMRAHFKSAAGISRMVMITFKPGWAAPLLGGRANALANQIVPLERIWGTSGSSLCEQLLAARDLPEVMDRLSDAIAARARAGFEPASARLVRRAVRLLEADEVRVETVAERLGVTARHLRRAFLESVGIGPKDFARAVRLQWAVRLSSSSHDWAQIASDAGYYDQSHLIADFHDLVGVTPAAFANPSLLLGARCSTTSPATPSRASFVERSRP
jgi:AraC-like DNA-binding protein